MQIVISGYYGCGNAGDEAVLAGIRESFLRRHGTARLIVLSQDPAGTQRLHGLEAVDRMDMKAARAALKGSDLLLSGGGSLLQDTTSLRSLLYYLAILRMARGLRVPSMLYAQGIGPLRRPLARALVRRVASRTAAITVRDPDSAALLRSIGVNRPEIEVTADPAFALRPASAGFVAKLIEAEGLPTEGPLIGVALRPWGGEAGEAARDAYARLLIELQTQCRARLVLLPMHSGEDVAFAEDIARRTGALDSAAIVRRAYPPDTLLGLIGRCDAVVAMRLHALIFAARMGTPPFALAYDPKVSSLMEGLGLEADQESWQGFAPEALAGRVAVLLAERDARSADLKAKAADLEQRALRNADRALEVATG